MFRGGTESKVNNCTLRLLNSTECTNVPRIIQHSPTQPQRVSDWFHIKASVAIRINCAKNVNMHVIVKAAEILRTAGFPTNPIDSMDVREFVRSGRPTEIGFLQAYTWHSALDSESVWPRWSSTLVVMTVQVVVVVAAKLSRCSRSHDSACTAPRQNK